MSLSAQRKKRKRNGTREGPVIKVGWQASTAAAARFSDRAKERGFAQGRRFHAISSEQATLASCWRSIWPAFLALPDHAALLCARHGVLAVDACARWETCRTHTTIAGAHGRASERTTGHAQIGAKPRRGPYFHRKAQIVPCDLISCLSQTRRPA